MYFIPFSAAFLRSVLHIVFERKKELKHACQVIDELEQQFNGKFDAPTRKKIATSHAVYNPLIIDAFCSLHGRVSNTPERKRLIYYFVCSSLLDNFFDRNELPVDQIEKICFDTDHYTPTTFDEKAFLHCHTTLLNYTKDKEGYLDVLHAEVAAQTASLQQFKKDVSNDTIESIMKAKGGNAVLLCRFYLENRDTLIEDQCWYQLGTIIQHNNDLFDIYKDINDGVETLATRCTNAYEMEKFALQQIAQLEQLTAQLPYTKKQKRRFAVSVAGICASNRIGTDRLKRLQGKADRLPDLSTLDRKQLIIDMEKPSTIMQWLKYVYYYGKRI